jgi:hypothetical protein
MTEDDDLKDFEELYHGKKPLEKCFCPDCERIRLKIELGNGF